MDNKIKTTFIKRTIYLKTYGQRVEFGFDVPIDWTPGKGACWIDCPFSVCTSFGHRCKALVNNLCPFTKNVETFNYTDGVWELIVPTDDTTQKERDFN